MKKNEKHTLRNVLLGTAVAGGTYALLRKPRYSHIPEIAKAQKASKGKVTSLVLSPLPRDYDKGLISRNPLRKMYNWFVQAGIKTIPTSRVKPGTHFRGTLYDDTSLWSKGSKYWKPSNVTGDVTYNINKAELRNRLQEKFVFSKMPEFAGNVLPTKTLTSILGARRPKGIKEMREALKAYPDIFIKVRTGEGFHYGFQGKPSQITHKKKYVRHLIRHPEKYIAQPYHLADKEYRVHAIIQGGKVQLPEAHIKAVKGVETTRPSFNPAKNKELSAYTHKVLKDYASKHKKDNMILGLDIFYTKKGKKKFIINEINDESGSFRSMFPYFITNPHRHYKALTGRISKPISTIVAGLTGGTALGASTLMDKIKTSAKKKKNKHIFSKVLATAVAIPVGAVAYKKFRVPQFSQNKYLKSIQEASRGRLTIADVFSNNPISRVLNRVFNPSVRFVAPEQNIGRKLEGAVINIGHKTNVKGDITINDILDRTKHYQLTNVDIKNVKDVPALNKWLIPSQRFSKVLQTSNNVSLEKFRTLTRTQAANVLKRIAKKHDLYIKPSSGERSIGIYSPIGEVEKRTIRTVQGTPRILSPRYPTKPIKELQLKGENYIVQENIHPIQELRFHTIGHKVIGEPQHRMPILTRGQVTGQYTKFPKNFNTSEFEKALQTTLKQRGIKHPTLMGWDLAVTPQGKIKIIEANTSSAFIFSPNIYSRYGKAYKAITGREPLEHSLTKSLGLAGLAGTSTYTFTKKGEAKSKSSILPTVLAGGTGLISGALAYYLLNKKLSVQLDKLIVKRMKRYATSITQSPVSKETFSKLKKLFKSAELNKKEQPHTTIGKVLAPVGIGAAGAGAYAFLNPKTNLHEKARRLLLSQFGYFGGRLPITQESAESLIPSSKIKTQTISKGKPTSLDKWLKTQKVRPMFGEDAELIIAGLDKKTRVPFVHNIEGGFLKTIKGEHFSLKQDPTAGGLEINVKPGHSEQLHRRYHRAITEGIPKLTQDPDLAVINKAFLKTTGRWGAGSSSHIHFQAPAHLLKSKLNRVIGTTAILNYLVPGAEERAKGYHGFGAVRRNIVFGRDLPDVRVWTRRKEKHLLRQHGISSNVPKKHVWKPAKGNIAAEIRFNAPMHGDPNLSRKYLQLVELSLSEHPAVKDFETLGKNIRKLTKGKTRKLFEPEVKTKVVSEFERIIGTTEFRKDKILRQLVSMAREGKQLPVINTLKAWSRFIR